ncbi:MAG: arabinofuranosyltransferase [Candidatus Hodarchaeota archaeon]
MSGNKEKSKTSVIKEKASELYKLDIFQEFLYAGIGCLAFIILFLLLPPVFWEEFYRNIICALITIGFFIIFVIFNQPNTRKKIFMVDYKRNIILFTVFSFAILSFLFARTDFAYSGLGPDNWYRSAMIAQMAHSIYPQDFAFKGFSAFMAPLYWYILAVFAALFQIESHKMVKFGFLFSYYILPILLNEAWKKLFSKKKSFYITALFFTFVANYNEIIWIDHLIGYMFFIPFFLYYFENYTNKEFSRKDYIIAGIIGSILVCTFYLYFILVPIYVFILLIQSKIQNNIKEFKNKIKRIFFISILIFIFSSWFWLPLTINILLLGAEGHQNLFFPNYALEMPFEEYLKFNLFSFILILGIIFVLLRYSRSNLLTFLGNIVISVYILYVLSFIGALAGFPLVHYRVLIVSYYVLVISFTLFYFEFFRILKKHKALKQFKSKVNLKNLEIFILLLIIFFQNYDNTVSLYKSDYYQDALNENVPRRVNIIEQLDYENKVFLLHYYEVAAFLPINLFIVYNPHFSHPSALNNERIVFLQELADCKDSKEFYQKMMSSKFGMIHYFYLKPHIDPVSLNITEYLFDAAQLEHFPERLEVEIYFRAEFLENNDYFRKITIDDEVIFKTRY